MGILAIDPGQQGAFVFLNGQVFEFDLMPLKTDGTKDVDFQAVVKTLERYAVRANVRVLLERAHPGAMGVTGAFNYGRGYAALEIAVAFLGFPVTYVEPAKWCKLMHEGIEKDLKPKAKSIIAVKRLFPKHVETIPKNKNGKLHEGVVDALLIAGYGARISGLEQKGMTADDF